MDLPLHVATGAVIGNALLYHEAKRLKRRFTDKEQVRLTLAVFLLSVASHLFWDAMPHYDWLFYVDVFKPLPQYWLIPQVLVTLLVIMLNLRLNRDAWLLTSVAMFGSIYPDVEKLLYFDFHLPRLFVIFRRHSCYLSPWSPWELAHKDFLVVFEIVVFLVFLGIMYGLARARRNRLFFHTLSPFGKFMDAQHDAKPATTIQ
jgi:hypothetical protein